MRRLLVLPVILLTGCGAVASSPRAVVPAASVNPSAADLLRDWDGRRAAAYADGSVAELRALYLPGSTVAEADVATMGEYLARGLRVDGMRMQVFALDVLDQQAGLLRLRVTDRLVGAAAVDAAGARTPLPRDLATTHEVVLREVTGQWLVEAVE